MWIQPPYHDPTSLELSMPIKNRIDHFEIYDRLLPVWNRTREKSIYTALCLISHKNENLVWFSINKAITSVKIDLTVTIY